MKKRNLEVYYLHSILVGLEPTGPTGFEGLIRDLLERWTGQRFRFARSGSQSGKDVTSDSLSRIFIAAEMKRYDQKSSLRLRDLLGGISEAIQFLPDLDLWILATTREIGDKEAEGLKREAEQAGIEILIFDSNAAGCGHLEAFCAKHPDVMRNFFCRNVPECRTEELDSGINSIQSNPNYESSVRQLGDILDATVFGFNSARNRAFQWLNKHIDSQLESKSAFLQDIGLHDKDRRSPIIRTRLNNQFDVWWGNRKADSAHAVLVGEEGTGKTWAAIAWLASKFTAEADPILLPVTSAQLSGTTDLHMLIIETLIKRCGKTDAYWKKRLVGWRNHPKTSGPLFILYLDGLNEKPNFLWRNLLVQANSNDWCGHVVFFMTSREEFYKTKVAFQNSGVKEIETTGYDDTELSQELQRADISISTVIPDYLRSLIRRPRYCDLALRHFADLLAAGDLTIERLLYQDYKERVEKKQNQPITDDDFKQILCGLAKKYMRGESAFDKAAIVTVLPGSDESNTILQEILDGGLMVKTKLLSAQYRVESQRLVYGLGMLLADHVAQEQLVSIDECANAAQTWLEPQSDMELKVSILGAAAFMSIMNKDYPAIARRALLRIWVGSRNMTDTQQNAVIAYLPDCSVDIVEVANVFWSTDQDNGVAQERLAGAFLKHRDNPKVKPILIDACKRWMSYLSLNGHPMERDSKKSNIDKLKQDLFKRFGKVVASGEISIFYGRNFFVTEDDNLLRMARFAMFLISAGDRLPFVEAFFQWAISRRLMGIYSESDEAKWVLRLAEEDLWPAFETDITQMATSEDETLKKAASLLLSCIGNRDANELIEKFLKGLYPAQPIQIEYEKDPYSSIFALPSRDHCEPCMARDDIPVEHIAEKIKKYLHDPGITAPAGFIARLRETASSLPATGYRATFSHTIQDHQFDTLIPVLARFSYKDLPVLMRQTVHSLDQRNEEGIRQLMIHLPYFGIVLQEPELAILDNFLAAYHRKACIWPAHDNGSHTAREIFAESRGALARIMHLTANEIPVFILNRPNNAWDLESLRSWFQSLSAETVNIYLAQFLTESSTVAQYRILWLMSNSKPTLSDEHRRILMKWLESDSNVHKYCAFRFTWLSGDQQLVDQVLQQKGFLHPETSRIDALVANIYWRYGHDVPLHNLIQRLPLEWIGNIIYDHSCHPDQLQLFANLLDTVWQSFSHHKELGDIDILSPHVETEQESGATFVHYREPSSDRSMRFISLYMSWHSGSSDEKNKNPKFSLKESPEDFDARQRAFHEQIEKLLNDGKQRWRYCQFNTELLAQVCRNEPDMVEKWIDTVISCNSERGLLLGSGFYQSLCAALFATGHPKGVLLWRRIRQHPHQVNFNNNLDSRLT